MQLRYTNYYVFTWFTWAWKDLSWIIQVQDDLIGNAQVLRNLIGNLQWFVWYVNYVLKITAKSKFN